MDAVQCSTLPYFTHDLATNANNQSFYNRHGHSLGVMTSRNSLLSGYPPIFSSGGMCTKVNYIHRLILSLKLKTDFHCNSFAYLRNNEN